MSFSADARQLAVNTYENTTMSVRDTAAACGISPTTLQKWRGRVKADESLEDRKRSGRPPKLSPEHVKKLVELASLHPDWTQRMFADALNEEFEGISVSQPMICITFKREKISFKKNNGVQTKKAQNE